MPWYGMNLNDLRPSPKDTYRMVSFGDERPVHPRDMVNPLLISYGFLTLAIVSEVTGSAFLQRSQQFTRIGPTLCMALSYVASFFFLSQALKHLPLGFAYAIWGGLGIVLTALISVIVFRQSLDGPAILGISLIIAGVIVMNVFSRSVAH